MRHSPRSPMRIVLPLLVAVLVCSFGIAAQEAAAEGIGEAGEALTELGDWFSG